MPDSIETVGEAPRGRVTLLADNPREPEIVFDFPFDEELNEAVRELPGRWFNWRLKHWRVPADPRLGKLIGGVLERFPALEVSPEVHAWLSDSDRWRALVSVGNHDGAGAFVLRTHLGRAAARACCARAWATGPGGSSSRSAPASRAGWPTSTACAWTTSPARARASSSWG